MNEKFVTRIAREVDEIKAAGLFKTERIMDFAIGKAMKGSKI